jgi:hypothetical protein
MKTRSILLAILVAALAYVAPAYGQLPGTGGMGGLIGASSSGPQILVGTFNPSDKGASITLSNANLTFATSSANSVRSTNSLASGAYFYEVTVTNQPVCGVGTASASLSNYPGVDANGISYFYNGQVIKNGATVATIASYTTADVISVAVDRTANTVNFYKNGSLAGGPYTPPTGTLFILCGANGVGSGTLSVTPTYPVAGYTLWGN